MSINLVMKVHCGGNYQPLAFPKSPIERHIYFLCVRSIEACLDVFYFLFDFLFVLIRIFNINIITLDVITSYFKQTQTTLNAVISTF